MPDAKFGSKGSKCNKQNAINKMESQTFNAKKGRQKTARGYQSGGSCFLVFW